MTVHAEGTLAYNAREFVDVYYDAFVLLAVARDAAPDLFTDDECASLPFDTPTLDSSGREWCVVTLWYLLDDDGRIEGGSNATYEVSRMTPGDTWTDRVFPSDFDVTTAAVCGKSLEQEDGDVSRMAFDCVDAAGSTFRIGGEW